MDSPNDRDKLPLAFGNTYIYPEAIEVHLLQVLTRTRNLVQCPECTGLIQGRILGQERVFSNLLIVTELN